MATPVSAILSCLLPPRDRPPPADRENTALAAIAISEPPLLPLLLQVSLTYWDDLQQRIPRAQVGAAEGIVRQVSQGF